MTGRIAGAAAAGTALVALAATGCRERQEDTPAAAAIDAAISVAGHTLAPEAVRAYLAAREGFTSRGGEVACSYVPLGVEGDRVFLRALCLEHVADGDTLAEGSGVGFPAALRVDTAGGTARIAGHQRPRDGGRFAEDVRAIFPPGIERRVHAPTDEANALARALRDRLRAEAAARLGRTAGRAAPSGR